MKKKIKYDWKITAKKIGRQFLFVLLAGLAAHYGNNPYYLMFAPLLEGVRNYLKYGVLKQ